MKIAQISPAPAFKAKYVQSQTSFLEEEKNGVIWGFMPSLCKDEAGFILASQDMRKIQAVDNFKKYMEIPKFVDFWKNELPQSMTITLSDVVYEDTLSDEDPITEPIVVVSQDGYEHKWFRILDVTPPMKTKNVFNKWLKGLSSVFKD